jgi:hypothetical protein
MLSKSNEAWRRFALLVRVFTAALVFLTLVIGFAPSATADSFTYSYVGNAYSQFGGTFACPPVCGITGSFTVAAALFPGAKFYFSPLSFSFTDGKTVLTPSDVTRSDFSFVTDGFGHIVGWGIELLNPYGEMFLSTNPRPCFDCIPVDGSFNPNIGHAEILNSPGTWTASSTVPEPSSLVMLCSGLLGLVGMRRRVSKKCAEVE